MDSPPIPIPRDSIVTVAEPATIQGGISLYPGVVWATGEPVIVSGPPGVYTVRTFGKPPVWTKPMRVELAPTLVVIEPPATPLEVAITEQRATLARLWAELTVANARLLELEARLEAGETEP